MNSVALLLVLSTPGIEYGWSPGTDGRLEYIIQLEPEALDALRGGKPISSDIHPDVRGVRRVVLRVGTDPVPRIAIDPRALETDPETNAGTPAQAPNSRSPQTSARNAQRQGAANTANPTTNRRSPGATIGRNVNDQRQRTAPPLLGNDSTQANDANASDAAQRSIYQIDDTGDYRLTDEVTEDGGGAYGTVPTPSRYNRSREQQPTQQPAEQQQDLGPPAPDSLWSRWSTGDAEQTDDDRWQSVDEGQPVDPQGIGDEAPPNNQRWTPQYGQQEEERSPYLSAADRERLEREQYEREQFERERAEREAADRAEFERWRRARAGTSVADVANRDTRRSGEFMPAGYTTDTESNDSGAVAGAVTQNGNTATNTNAIAPPATDASTTASAPPTSGNDLFKELLLFASLGVNVAAVVIARQYYLRYCMLISEVRQSETLSS